MRQIHRYGGFLVTMASTAVWLAAGFIWARQQLALPTLIAAFLSWNSYLAAHWFVTGSFMDGDGEENTERRWWGLAGVAAGGAVLVGGMLLGVRGIHRLDLPVTIGGAVLFLTGYVIAHYAATGELL